MYKRYKVTYMSAFCMQTTAQANLCNSPPERSSTFRSFRWVRSTKNIDIVFNITSFISPLLNKINIVGHSEFDYFS